MVLVIKNSKIVFPDSILDGGVVVDDGLIKEVFSAGRAPGRR